MYVHQRRGRQPHRKAAGEAGRRWYRVEGHRRIVYHSLELNLAGFSTALKLNEHVPDVAQLELLVMDLSGVPVVPTSPIRGINYAFTYVHEKCRAGERTAKSTINYPKHWNHST